MKKIIILFLILLSVGLGNFISAQRIIFAPSTKIHFGNETTYGVSLGIDLIEKNYMKSIAYVEPRLGTNLKTFAFGISFEKDLINSGKSAFYGGISPVYLTAYTKENELAGIGFSFKFGLQKIQNIWTKRYNGDIKLFPFIEAGFEFMELHSGFMKGDYYNNSGLIFRIGVRI
ncbi:hypothetical protein GW932_01475 [archaeon]|nr:hypothetical protein [archaeon]